MYKWIDKEIKKFPNLENEFPTNQELSFVNKIFPEIKTTNDFLKNKKAKIMHNPDGSKSDLELSIAISWPAYSNQVYNASFDANNICREIFNNPNINLDLNDNVNAIRHATWNMCSVSKIASLSSNKWKGLKHAEIAITAHEYKNTSSGSSVFFPSSELNDQENKTNYMDAYNNLVGRTYCYNTIGQTWLGNANNIPSYNKIKTDVQNFSIITVSSTDVNEIYNQSSPSLTIHNLLGIMDIAYDYGNSSISQKLVRF